MNKILNKIGFIGCGNMGEAMLSGMLKSKKIMNDQIYAHTFRNERMNYLKEKYSINIVDSNIDVVNNSNIIILATKPDKYEEVLNEVKSSLTKNHLLISITPSFTLNKLSQMVDNRAQFVRAMPNTPSFISMGMAGLVFNVNEHEDVVNLVKDIFNTFGDSMIVEESMIPILSTLSGSSPAFIYLFSKVFTEYGVNYGFTLKEAKELFAKTLIGSAHMILESSETLEKLVENVCSPNGSTIEGINFLRNNGFETVLNDGIDKTTQKFKKMTSENK